MNKQPVSYLQTDARWKNKDYSTKGESTTIAESGCGPTCAAMLIETITGKTYTPEDACNWSLKHGYKALKQGTYYSYFVPQFKEFGIKCEQLSWTNTYGKPNSEVHTKAFNLLKQGYYLIACMGKGNWTKSGHFIVVWWEDGKVRINDPASTKNERLNGNLTTFKSQVKYYWAIDAREYNKGNSVSPIAEIQSILNKKYGLGLKVDGSWGPASKKAMIKAVQTEINELYGSNLVVDGSWGPASKEACPDVKSITKNNLAWLIQACLVVKSYDIETDGSYGPACANAIKQFQRKNGLSADGICGPNTFTKLLS